MRKIPLAVRTAVLVFFLLTLLPRHGAGSEASEMTARVKSAIDSAFVVLNDPALMGKEKTTERRARLRSAIQGGIDFEEMTKRSLGIHWRKRTPEERREFVALFSRLLEDSYMDKIEANYDAKVYFRGEKLNKKGTRGLVKTVVVTRKGTEVPMEYRMMKKKDRGWVAYDIVIEGVSLVSNYRTQFNQIIQRSSYEDLVKGLRRKLEGRKSYAPTHHHEKK
jgi:phospholipid transport system substrate-binding protein